MLESMGLPKNLRVLGWGLSLERPTMIKYGVQNIRELLGHKVSLDFIESNPAARLDEDLYEWTKWTEKKKENWKEKKKKEEKVIHYVYRYNIFWYIESMTQVDLFPRCIINQHFILLNCFLNYYYAYKLRESNPAPSLYAVSYTHLFRNVAIINSFQKLPKAFPVPIESWPDIWDNFCFWELCFEFITLATKVFLLLFRTDARITYGHTLILAVASLPAKHDNVIPVIVPIPPRPYEPYLTLVGPVCKCWYWNIVILAYICLLYTSRCV